MDMMLKSETENLLDEIAEIKCPLAMMYASNSVLFTPQLLDIYRNKYPESTQFYCLENAQHHLLLDQPLAYIDLIKKIQNTL